MSWDHEELKYRFCGCYAEPYHHLSLHISMAATSQLLASHLTAQEVLSRFVEVEGCEEFDESEREERMIAFVSAWSSGGGLVFDRGPCIHVLLMEGMRRVSAKLLCSRNVSEPGARAFREIYGVPEFVTRAEASSALAERSGWGARCGGGAQLEVTVFGARGLAANERSSESLQLIARTLSSDAKAYVLALAPALCELRGEFGWPDPKADNLSRDWARSASRSPDFWRGMSVAEGIEWVRARVGTTTPDKAAPKDKVKLLAKGGRARTFISVVDKAPRPQPMVFAVPPHRGTRLKIELKQRKTFGGTTNLGRLDIVVDDLVRKNSAYPTGWLPLTHGKGELQIRLYYLDPNDSDTFDPTNLSGGTSRPSTQPPTEDAGESVGQSDASDGTVVPDEKKTDFSAPETALSKGPVLETPGSVESQESERSATKSKPPPPPPPKRNEAGSEKEAEAKRPPPPPPKRSEAGSGEEAEAKRPPPPPQRKPPPPLEKKPEVRRLAPDLASQLAAGASLLHKPAERPPPEPASNTTIFDDLAARIQSIRTDVADSDSDDDDFD